MVGNATRHPPPYAIPSQTPLSSWPVVAPFAWCGPDGALTVEAGGCRAYTLRVTAGAFFPARSTPVLGVREEYPCRSTSRRRCWNRPSVARSTKPPSSTASGPPCRSHGR
ncbi:hypothetical protein C6N75_22270 [Streptomyces solincola]|uniref:Uncharacterized protein n=1 Tax=Streptomyces solincola TaxID=2100817 RepID=A0A2S9PRL4_9ACTN|nr:hypothetical protein C6N75_22270 [Streptomyces solincola]